MTSVTAEQLRRFRDGYAEHRASEGRGSGGTAELLALPYLTSGPLARSWQVRARTFECFVRDVVTPLARALARPLRVLDLGAGNGWLCYRMQQHGHVALAVDFRTDTVDGLGATAAYTPHVNAIASSFDCVPVAAQSFDVTVFNAALHYALDLRAALTEAARVTNSGGRIVILDSPFYASERAGAAMVAQKRRDAVAQFGARADTLTALPFVEFLTADRLADASAELQLQWRRTRVRYPLWYELRPVLARLRGQREPSRFDLWQAVVP